MPWCTVLPCRARRALRHALSDAERAGQIDLNGLAAHMRENLPPYAVPRFIRIGQKSMSRARLSFKNQSLKMPLITSMKWMMSCFCWPAMQRRSRR